MSDLPKDYNMLELNWKLQEMCDNQTNARIAELYQGEQDIRSRSLFMSGLYRDLRAIRMKKDEKDPIELEDKIRERIIHFRNEMWNPLQEANQGIITDDYHPFPEDLDLDELTAEDIDPMLDKLSVLLDQEQNVLTHLTRDLKKVTDDAYLITEMTSYRAKQDPIKTFVRNQRSV